MHHEEAMLLYILHTLLHIHTYKEFNKVCSFISRIRTLQHIKDNHHTQLIVVSETCL